MTATLTIKAEAAGAVSVLEGVNRLIDGSVKASERLAAVTATIRGHWSNISNDLSGILRQVQAVAQATQQVAGAANYTHAGFLASLGAAQRLSAELSKIRADAIQAARAMNGIRPHGGGFGGSTFTGGTGGFTFSPGNSPPSLPSLPAPAPAGASGGSSSGGGLFSDRNRSTYGSGIGDLGVGSAISASVRRGADLVESAIGKSLRFAWREFEMAAKTSVAVVAGLIGNSIRLAMEAEPISAGFGTLTKSNGLGDQAKVLKELQEAAKGTISELSLMESANKALMLGAASTTEELKLLIEGGRRLGKAMGLDAKEGFERLATGIGRHSSKILDDLGIVLKSQQVYDDYAAIHKTTADKLSEEEKQLAFVGAAYAKLTEYMEREGEEQDSATEKVQRAKAAFSDLSVHFGEKFLPAIGEVADKWALFMRSLSADDPQAGMTKAVEVAKQAAKSASSDFTNLLGSTWKAFTDPSKGAFEIVGYRFEQWINSVEAKFLRMWSKITSIVDTIMVDIQGGIAIATGSDTLLDKAGSNADKLIERWNAPIKAAESENKKIEDKIKKIVLPKSTDQGDSAPQGPAAYYGSLAKAGGPTESGMTTAAKQAEATARREAQQAMEKAEKESKDAAREALQKEIRAREDVIRQIERENSAIEDRMRDLDAARTNANAALAGFDDPNKTVASRLNDLSSELRKYPDTFKRIGDRIAENGDQMADAMKQWDDELTKTLADLNRGIQRQAQSFLQEGPQDGESVRVRSLKRRAQKEQRQYNNDLINGAFRSPSLDSIGGDFGGFGAQNTERNPRVLNQRFPGLERALLGLRGNDGTTQLQQVQEHVNEVVQQHLEELKKARQQQGELFKEQANAHAEQKKTQTEITNLLKLASSNYAELAQTSAANAKEIQSIKREMEKTAQQVRSLK